VRVILLGPPGAGKGTQARRLAARYGVPHVATGDILRFAVAWGTEIGLRAKRYMDAGELVPDEVVLELVRLRVGQPDARAGFVLDGFPRTLAQARALDAMLAAAGRAPDAAVSLEVPDETIVRRLAARRSCPACGRVYNLLSDPPRDPEVCDRDGTPLVQRDDDRPDVVARRLEVYRRDTLPVLAHYRDRGLLRAVDGTGDEEEVLARILEAVGNLAGERR
jgi:adenylate kinase